MERRPAAITRAALLTALLFTPAAARADTITITGGNMSWAGGPVLISLSGTSGFSLNAGSPPELGLFAPWINCIGLPETCAPGQTVSLFTSFGSIDVPGKATLHGNTYEIGSPSGNTEADVQFTGGFVAPPFSGSETLVTAPFTLTGNFRYSPDAVGATTTTLPFSGGGIASVWLNPGNLGGYRLARVRYDISPSSTPTPEPASLLLLGGGLAAVIARRRR